MGVQNTSTDGKPNPTMNKEATKVLHTQGEWEIQGQLGTTTVMSGAIHIALVMDCDFKDRREQEANARLIAAAPKMLETLAEILDIYENKKQNGTPLTVYEIGIMATIKTAIEKATNP